MAPDELTTATAFWSYAHSDDEEGQVRRLKEKLDLTYKRHRGEGLASFFDRTGKHKIEWGEEWRSKISATIFGTTFFIPVISPSYVKSSMCRDEFDEFVEKAKSSDLEELIMPILWVPVYPETDDEQRIYDVAKSRQWIDWSDMRKLDESRSEYKGLIDEMGERLANAARKVAKKPEVVIEADNKSDPSNETADAEVEDPPGLVDLFAETAEVGPQMSMHMQAAYAALQGMQSSTAAIEPLHPNASAGQRLFFYKRVANEITPYASEFENEAEAAEEVARHLDKTIFDIADILKDPTLRGATDYNQSLEQLNALPAAVRKQLGDINAVRSAVSRMGRVSRDLRPPVAAMERGFDSLDAIFQMVDGWVEALRQSADSD